MTALLTSDAPRRPMPSSRRSFSRSVLVVLGWELEKLSAQWRTRAAFALCLLGPFAFVLAVKATGTLPEDTLFGRSMLISGFATPLVALGFAASWGFPLLVCVVAGDIFSAEDHLGTWKTILTRSCSRGAIFTGKALAVVVYALSVVAVLACSSLAAGALVVGRQPIIGLSGNLISASNATELIVLSWLSVLPPVLAFASIGVVLSVVSRNSLVGILGAAAIGLVMQFAGMIDGARPLQVALLGTHFLAWHGLFADPQFTRPISEDLVVSVIYLAVCGSASWFVLRRRDVAAG